MLIKYGILENCNLSRKPWVGNLIKLRFSVGRPFILLTVVDEQMSEIIRECPRLFSNVRVLWCSFANRGKP